MKNIFYPRDKKARILIIDDEKDIGVYLKAKMERTGKFEAWATTSPYDGISLAREHHPDLILLDIMMPEMDGTEVAERLSSDRSTKDILIVFFSVLADRQDVEKNDGTIGGRPFIPKNIEGKEVVAHIESLLQGVHAAK